MPVAASPLPLAVSMGEPAGIGPDLILRLHARRAELGLPPFIVYGHLNFLRSRAARLGLAVTLEASTPGEAAARFGSALPVAHVEGLVPDKPGDPSPLSGKVVIEAITQAVNATMTGTCRGIVTAPIHKAALYAAGFKYPGHTEFLAALTDRDGNPPMPVMMLAHDDLRVVPATIHVPIRDVPALLTLQLVADTGRIVAHDLRTRFGIAEPRIGFAGLNPHAGEGGNIGREDFDIVAPAISQLQHEGILAEGPMPADTLFYLPHWRRYDAVIAMYHDQALIPIKTVAFDEAVNVTLGLPIVRTSPDHGTAFDLAGTGKGSETSFLAAIRLADRLTGGAD
ncbi:4-hydroxythreonine-4-phosphate dehydrogenase PdxA [Devosia sp. ZB163]|uniref:4-hydroxythreonine-4-phosphate dehydrogenase PdxA n=1 Tax=Devosia sp. ZB163 TaxID=3025938 RepID=UPI00235E8067|nr:4-hydroxythreonine-4-phosphate dehydrogenase PdxA [Devosia sp. ZB163]MDC9824046.1 4-hydroxythreonine-4-phosphate dehydrogenase PdxA [Devosia sp. ZB163]